MISTLYCISKLSSDRSLQRLKEWKKSEIRVEISGQVKKPGSYSLLSGDALEKAIRASKPKSDADLASIEPGRILYEDCKIEIPRLSKISIRVRGCVKNSVELDLPVGSRICDLKGVIDPAPGFDPAFFRRKRLLKNREEVVVPEQKK